ncbi:MAG TPA: transposase [Fimbriimonas sp.]|nr:transposase [Fimbriimonas sp.]
MPLSLSAVYLHLVFSTKERVPSIPDEHIQDLHGYLGGIARGLKCQPLGIGGVADHVHVLAKLDRSVAIADLVRDLKSHSTPWMKQRVAAFSWQIGYGVFSFSERELPAVQRYVRGQAEHHKTVSFQDELRALLADHGLEADERYLWD